MSSVRAEVIHAEHRFRSRAFVSEIRYDTKELVVTLTSPDEGLVAAARFSEVVGFRVLDEGNLLEFWPQCSMGHGWLHRVEQGGWFDQEVGRAGFLLGKVNGLYEYLVVSQNECVSVLAGEPPSVEWSGP